MKKKYIIFLSVIALFVACSVNLDLLGMIDGQSAVVHDRFTQSMLYNVTTPEIHLQMPEEYEIYVCTDSHIDHDYYGLSRFIHEYAASQGPHFALHLGDLINGQGWYDRADSILHLDGVMSTREDTLFIIPGNHDIYFGQWTEFVKRYHHGNYWFDTECAGHKQDLFIGLDSAEGSLGVDQMDWLRRLLADKQQEGYRHIIVFTHTHMWMTDTSQGHTSNYPLEETYDITGLLSKYGVEAYWSGHDHSRDYVKFGGVDYLLINACTDVEPNPYYLIAHMSKTIEYEWVSLAR